MILAHEGTRTPNLLIRSARGHYPTMSRFAPTSRAPVSLQLAWAERRTGKASAYTVRSATVGGSRDARTAGIRPANAPMRTAEAMPPNHASTGITMVQFLVLA
jgi:hypothetical protein